MMPHDDILARKIAAAQQRHRVVALCTGVALAVAFFCAWLLLGSLIDWRADLPRSLRLVLLAANVAGSLGLLLRFGLLPAARGIDEEAIALAVERMDRRFSTRLIAAVQLRRPGALAPGESVSVLDALLHETQAAARQVDFNRAIPATTLRRATRAAAGALLLGLVILLAGGDRIGALLRRGLGTGETWPSRTKVHVAGGNFLVAIGDSAHLSASASGYHPDAGIARITYADGRRQSVTLTRISDDQYAGTLDNVPEPFTYRVELFDDVSENCRVDAQPRPLITALACTQVFPAYTGMKDARRDPADLLLLEGSRLRLRITVSHELLPPTAGPRASRVILQSKPGAATTSAPGALPLLLQPDPADSRVWTAEFQPTPDVAGFAIHLVDPLGLETHDEPVYPIRLTSDRPPTIRMLQPQQRQSLATADATCAIACVAEDDFGLAGLWLHYRIDSEAEVTVPLTLPAGQKEARMEYAWHFSTLAPPAGHPGIEGCVVDFYLEARDTNPAATGVTDSEHYQARIVSKADKQAELIARMAGSFAGIQELSDKQTRAATELRAVSIEPPPTSQPLTRPATQSQPAAGGAP